MNMNRILYCWATKLQPDHDFATIDFRFPNNARGFECSSIPWSATFSLSHLDLSFFIQRSSCFSWQLGTNGCKLLPQLGSTQEKFIHYALLAEEPKTISNI